MSFSDVVGIIGLVVSIGAIPLSIFLARKGRQRPQLRHAVDTTIALSPDDGLLTSGLKMRFGSSTIYRVVRTSVALWNAQGDTIHRADIVGDDPLRIALDASDNILEARLISSSRQQNKVAISIPSSDRATLLIDFDFLDERDGVVVELLHQTEKPIQVLGTLRGVVRSSAQSMDLSPARLRHIAERSSPRRIANFYRRQKYSILMGFCVLALFPQAVIDSPLADTVYGRDPQVVDATRYDISSLLGQRDLALAIREVGQTPTLTPDWLSVTMLIALCVAVGVLLPLSFYSGRLGRLPPEVANNFREAR